MIVVYPMLVSKDVSRNAIPGICKTLEKFLIVYKLDDILNELKPSFKKDILTTTGLRRENIELDIQDQTDEEYYKEYDSLYENFLLEASGQKPKPQVGSGLKDTIQKAVKDAMKDSGGNKNITYKKDTFIDMPKKDDMSLEPTYIQVDTKTTGPTLVGVKVIPFAVKSENDFVAAFLDDAQRKKMNYKVAKYSRKATRLFQNYLRKFKLGGKKTLSGDPTQDVILSKSAFADKTFVLFNYMNIKNSDVFENPKTVKKLQSLSWGSYVIADDVNQRAFFCMKQFRGLCSIVLYRYMFESISATKGSMNNAYEDLQDIKKSATPFFSVQRAPRKVFGESKADNKLLKYMTVLEENNQNIILKQELNEMVLNEDFKSFINTMKDKLNFKNIFKKVDEGNKSGNMGMVKKALNPVPKLPMSKIESMCSKISPYFKNNYEMAKKVIKNSSNITDEQSIKSIACVAALTASVTGKDDKNNIKKILTSTVKTLNSNKNVSESSDPTGSAKEKLFELISSVILNLLEYITEKGSQLGKTIIKKPYEKIVTKKVKAVKSDQIRNYTNTRLSKSSFTGAVKDMIANVPGKFWAISILIIVLLVLAKQLEEA